MFCFLSPLAQNMELIGLILKRSTNRENAIRYFWESQAIMGYQWGKNWRAEQFWLVKQVLIVCSPGRMEKMG